MLYRPKTLKNIVLTARKNDTQDKTYVARNEEHDIRDEKRVFV